MTYIYPDQFLQIFKGYFVRGQTKNTQNENKLSEYNDSNNTNT
jgi:hypothetical protein